MTQLERISASGEWCYVWLSYSRSVAHSFGCLRCFKHQSFSEKKQSHDTADMFNRKPKTKLTLALLLNHSSQTHTDSAAEPKQHFTRHFLEQSWKDGQREGGWGHSPSHPYRWNGLGCQTSQRWRWERGDPQSTGGWGGWLLLEVRRNCILGLEGKGWVLNT